LRDARKLATRFTDRRMYAVRLPEKKCDNPDIVESYRLARNLRSAMAVPLSRDLSLMPEGMGVVVLSP